MSSNKQFTIHINPINQSSHLIALSWDMHDDPPVCRSSQCRTNKYVEWHDGEWKCSKCDRIVEP